MSDELLLSDINPPPNPRNYTNINELQSVCEALYDWTLAQMKLFAELLPEGHKLSIRKVPNRAFFLAQPIVVLHGHYTTIRKMRNWYDYLVREYEPTWTEQPTLKHRLQHLQAVIMFMNRLHETIEQREMRVEQSQMMPGMIMLSPQIRTDAQEFPNAPGFEE